MMMFFEFIAVAWSLAPPASPPPPPRAFAIKTNLLKEHDARSGSTGQSVDDGECESDGVGGLSLYETEEVIPGETESHGRFGMLGVGISRSDYIPKAGV
jgi:hypothetical protein